MFLSPTEECLASLPLAEHAERNTDMRCLLIDAACKLEQEFKSERARIREHTSRIGEGAYCVLDFRARWRHKYTYLYLEWSTQKRVNNGQGGKRPLRGHIEKSRGEYDYSLRTLQDLAPVEYHGLIARIEGLARPIRAGFVHLRAIAAHIDEMTESGLGPLPDAASAPALSEAAPVPAHTTGL
jgi:hypothetical protein